MDEPAIRIGISGWTYAPWRGTFYPAGLPHRRELAHASSLLDSIEVNGSFYSLQRPTSWQRWHDETPDDFVMAVKGPRFITHMKQLRDVEVPLANFLASGLLALGPKLGPLLWQLPPTLVFDEARVRAFLAQLPHTTTAAADLATRHDERMTGRAVTTTDAERPLHHVVEVRHPSFAVPAFTDLMREHGIGTVVADSAGRFPQLTDVTSDLVYVRLHGADELYVSGYTDTALDEWAAKVLAWHDAGLAVHVYFDNDAKVRSPVDAMNLANRVRAHLP